MHARDSSVGVLESVACRALYESSSLHAILAVPSNEMASIETA